MDSSHVPDDAADDEPGVDESEPTARVEVTHDPAHHVGTTVARGIAEVTGTPVEDLAVELNDYVDPDALNRLFGERLDGTDRTEGRVVFPVQDCVVEVYADYRVVVRREA
jgi:hypothetical protein